MKNNYSLSKNYKTSFVILLLLFCGLFANKAGAQTVVANHDTYTWIGVTSSDWATATNWSILRGTANAGIGTYPGESVATDVVFINNSGTPFPAILAEPFIIDIARLNVTNALGSEAGATFTINAGAVLNVGNYALTVGTTIVSQSNNVLLAGGSIVNNGTLNITGRGVGFTNFPSYGINCGAPPVLPTVPREYSYSGTGTLSINLETANFANAAAIGVTGNSGTTTTPTNHVNVTYKMVLNNPEIILNPASVASIGVIRANGGNNPVKLIIAGTGVTRGTVGIPAIGSMISMGSGTVTVETGTTLTLNSASANTNPGMLIGNASATQTSTFTNKGTINILGASTRSGLVFTTFTTGAALPINVANEGTININLDCNTVGNAPLASGNGGSTGTTSLPVNLTNSGTLNLINTSVTAGTGAAIFGLVASQAPPVAITNNGTLNLEGSSYSYGNKFSIINNSILNSNSELRNFSAITNNLGGSINFVRTAATATTRQVTFEGLSFASAAGLGTTFTDSNLNIYGVVSQKFTSTTGGTTLTANVLSGAVIALSGNLTKTGTGGGDATIAYTSVSVPALNGAATGTVTNSGTINTDTASNLNILSLVSTTATSVLSPGGDSGKGILTIPTLPSSASFSLALNGTLKIQASGSTTAGVDYDTMQMTGVEDFIDISAATLDVTGLYTPTALTTLYIITSGAIGSVVGNFASVIGLPAKWTVVKSPGLDVNNPPLGNKVQLVYDPNLGTDTFAEAQFSYYPNPTRNELNLTAAKNISTVEMFNLLGQKVLSSAVDANQKQLNLSNLPSGVYLMEVTIENSKESFKIMKQ